MSLKVLVVDDSVVMRNVLEDVLVTAGYNVTTAPNGVEGLELAYNDTFDMIFLDIDMPNLSGLQVCRMLRNNPSHRNLPIVMLTARDQKKDQFWGLETGANAYLTKPLEPEALLKTVSKVLEECSAKAAAAMPALAVDQGQQSKDLIFQAGEVQEKQLFKMTLVNRIYEISTVYRDLRETCHAINDIYTSVIDFDIAMSMITDEDFVKMYIFVNRPVNKKFFQAAKNRLMREYETQTGRALIKENVEVIIEDPRHGIIKGAAEENIAGFHSRIMRSKGEDYGILVMARSRVGQFTPEELEMSSIISGQSEIVVDNVRMYEKIQRFAVADGLTGLYNHRYFQDQLDKEFSRARRFNLSLALIMLDIDNFKEVNDTYGHQQGDVILKELARVMKKCVREIDLVARYGGEEFTVILPETPKKSAVTATDRLLEAIQEHNFPHGSETMRITASMGVSGYPEDNIQTQLDLIAKADLALYKAKRDGRNRVCLYAPELEDEFS